MKTTRGRKVQPAKPLWRVFVTTAEEAQEAASELLSRVFVQPAVTYTEFSTRQSTVAVFLKEPPTSWIRCRGEISKGLAQIQRCGLEISPGRVGCVKVKAEDWAESWKRHFKPLKVGNALLVLPSWSKRQPKPGQAVVILDPGLSFGTGQHPTTAFCLAQVVAGRRRGAKSLLDIGTGSGILAISAAKLNYSRVGAFDYDADSIRVANQNARMNRVQRLIKLWRQDVRKLSATAHRKYDVVCANLTADLLLEQRSRIMNHVDSQGFLALAGILGEEFDRVRQAYESEGLILHASKAVREWRSGVFVRP